MTACHFDLMFMQTTDHIISSWKFRCYGHHFHFSMSFLDQTLCLRNIWCWPGLSYGLFSTSGPERPFTVDSVDHSSLIFLIHHAGDRLKGIFFGSWQNTGNTDGSKSFDISPDVLIGTGIGHRPATKAMVMYVYNARKNTGMPDIFIFPVPFCGNFLDCSITNGDIAVYKSIFCQNPF